MINIRLLICYMLSINFICLASKNVYIIPFEGFGDNILFDITHRYNRDNVLKPFYELKQNLQQQGYIIKTTNTLKGIEKDAYVVCFNIPTHIPSLMNEIKTFAKDKLVLFIWEPPVTSPIDFDKNYHQYFGKIYTLFDDLSDGQQYYKFNYPQPTLSMIDPIVEFNQKKLCTMIVGHKYSNHSKELYSARRKIIDFFEKFNNSEFEFYGRGWDAKLYKNYKGSTRSKIDCLKNYKFCVCYENMRDTQGYITEKIFDAMIAGCVPIYWGAQNICDYIPQGCFIAREQFADEKELYQYLKNMSEETYTQYITRIKNFLMSKKSQLFAIDNFIITFLQAIEVDII